MWTRVRPERFKRKRVHIDAIFGRPFCSFVFALFVHTSGFDLGNWDFGFQVLVSALLHGQIQLSVLEWEAYLFMGSVCWLSIWDFVAVGNGGEGFWLYLRINIYLLCYFRRFIRALHASANGIRAARIVSAIVGHRSSSPAWIAPYLATIRSTLMRYVSGYTPHSLLFPLITLSSLCPTQNRPVISSRDSMDPWVPNWFTAFLIRQQIQFPAQRFVLSHCRWVHNYDYLSLFSLFLSLTLSVSSYFHLLNFLLSCFLHRTLRTRSRDSSRSRAASTPTGCQWIMPRCVRITTLCVCVWLGECVCVCFRANTCTQLCHNLWPHKFVQPSRSSRTFRVPNKKRKREKFEKEKKIYIWITNALPDDSVDCTCCQTISEREGMLALCLRLVVVSKLEIEDVGKFETIPKCRKLWILDLKVQQAVSGTELNFNFEWQKLTIKPK